MNRRCTLARQALPNLISREYQDRRKHARKRIGDPVERRLRRTPRRIAWRKRVQPILDDVKVPRGKRDGAKIVERVIDRVKLISLVSRAHFLDHGVEFSESPAIDLEHFV